MILYFLFYKNFLNTIIEIREDDPAWLEVKNNEGSTGFIPEENVKVKDKFFNSISY